MNNRRECIRCGVVDVTVGPDVGAIAIDVSETGLGWIGETARQTGDILEITSEDLFERLGLPYRALTVRVRDVYVLDESHFRIGAELVAPSTELVAALRRLLLRLQRGGGECQPELGDVILWPSTGEGR